MTHNGESEPVTERSDCLPGCELDIPHTTCARLIQRPPDVPSSVGVASPADDGALVERLREAILDIDAHATPFGEDADGFVAGGYMVTIGSLHRALGVLGHGAPKCRHCALLQADGKPGCDELRHEVSEEWNRNALESIATALGVSIEADYGMKPNGILLDDILNGLTKRATDA